MNKDAAVYFELIPHESSAVNPGVNPGTHFNRQMKMKHYLLLFEYCLLKNTVNLKMTAHHTAYKGLRPSTLVKCD